MLANARSRWSARLVVLLALTALAAGQCPDALLLPLDHAPSDQVGASLAYDDDRLLVGAPNAWRVDPNEGGAHVFVRQGGVWIEEQRLPPPDPDSFVYFGGAVAIDGDTLLVGAPGQEDQPAAGAGGDYTPGPWPNAISPGAAYVYERGANGWTLTQRLQPALLPYLAWFGTSVALQGDVAFVGAPRQTVVGPSSGAVHVFDRTPAGWVLRAELVPSNASAGSWFGSSLAVEGTTLVVGARTADVNLQAQGSAYVFEEIAGEWVEVASLAAPDGDALDHFGANIDLSNGTLAVAAPRHSTGPFTRVGAVYVYEGAGASWTFTEKLLAPDRSGYDELGSDLVLDGDTLAASSGLIGHLNISTTGAAYVWRRDGTWKFVTKLQAAVPQQFGFFGVGLALEGDDLFAGHRGDDTGELNGGAVAAFKLAPWARAQCRCGSSGPCGNHDSTAGCKHGAGFGARLGACGSPSVAADDLVLRADRMPIGELALLVVGTASLDTPFGAGELCVGGATRRFPAQGSGAAGVVTFGPGLGAHAAANFGAGGAFVAGETRYFQAWYRDSGGLCGSAFNTTHALRLTLTP